MPLRESPIQFDSGDAGAYVPRRDLERRLAAAGRASGVLLFGDRGSGKTTMLNWLARELEREGRPVARVDASLAGSTLELLELVRAALPAPGPAPAEAGPPGALRLHAAIGALRGDGGASILLDNLVDHEIIGTLFGRMRDLVWATGHRWVVTARRPDRHVFLRPPADAFFAVRIALAPLDDQELRAFAALGGATRLPPAETRLPRDVVQHLLGLAWTADDGAEASIDNTARRVLRELQAIGRPVAPDDEELLERLCVSTFTLRRHLRALARRGLIEHEREHLGRAGRPRLLYAATQRS